MFIQHGDTLCVLKITLRIEAVRRTMSGYLAVVLVTTGAGTLLLLVLGTLHKQTIQITSLCAVFLKYVQLYLCISGTLLLLALGSLDRETIWLTRAASSHQPFSHNSLYFFLLS